MSIYAVREVKSLIENNEGFLSPSLRMTKYAMIEKDKKKEAIEFICKAKPETFNGKCFSWIDNIPNAEVFTMKLASRMIINQAGGVLENANLCIHRHFGVPYIPGSALKGIARHYAWEEWITALEDEDKETAELYAINLALTFGFPAGNKKLDFFLTTHFPHLFDKKKKYESFAGCVIFFPAYPDSVSQSQIEIDVLTCHHMNYYGNQEIQEAHDTEKPNPQFFPTIKQGVKFKFALKQIRKTCEEFEPMYIELDQKIEINTPRDFAKYCLVKALSEAGVGAKVNAGYGWFNEYKEITNVAETLNISEEEVTVRVKVFGKLPDTDFIGKINKFETLSHVDKKAILKLLSGNKKNLLSKVQESRKGKKVIPIIQQAATQYGVKLS